MLITQVRYNIDNETRGEYLKETTTSRKAEEKNKMKTNPKKYFEKHGYIYGDSYKFFLFGFWSHKIKKFTNFEEAEKWLNTEENDFRIREFITKSEARKLARKGGEII